MQFEIWVTNLDNEKYLTNTVVDELQAKDIAHRMVFDHGFVESEVVQVSKAEVVLAQYFNSVNENERKIK